MASPSNWFIAPNNQRADGTSKETATATVTYKRRPADNGAITGSDDYITAQVTAKLNGEIFTGTTERCTFYSTDGKFTALGKTARAYTDPDTRIAMPVSQITDMGRGYGRRLVEGRQSE
jgi:hypothetical protein